MGISAFVIWMICLLAFTILQFATLDDVYKVVVNNLSRYLWFFAGWIVMLVVDRLFKKNSEILKTLHHEATHLLISILTFRKILMLQVDATGGQVSSIGKRWMLEAVSLSPYCFPLLAYIVMVFTYFFAYDMSHISSLLLGMAYMFHLLCLKSDFFSFSLMGSHQTDINQYPLLFSYTFIFCFWLFNTQIVLLSVRRDFIQAYAFMFEQVRQTIIAIF